MDDHGTPGRGTGDWEDEWYVTPGGEYHIRIEDGWITAAKRTLKQLNILYRTGFELMRFRRPTMKSTGRWDCRFQLPVLVTRYGETTHERGLPTRRMFDVRYARAQIMHDRYDWKISLGLEPYGDGLRLDISHPIEQSVRALSMDDLIRAGMLMADGEKPAMPGLYALVERQSRIALPVAADCRLKIKAVKDSAPEPAASHKNTLVVSVKSVYSFGRRDDTVYDHYTDTPSTITDEEVLRRLHADSALLRREVMLRDGERYRIIRNAVAALRADNRSDADDGRELRNDA